MAPSIVDHHVAPSSRLLVSSRSQSRYGENRTGVMVAAYRVLIEGVRNEEAIEEMRPYQGLWFKVNEGVVTQTS